MNTLSWMIYAAEVCDRVQGAAGFISFMFGILGGACVVALWITNFAAEGGPSKAVIAMMTALFFFIEIPLIGAASFIPSSRTIYMIAASEAGMTVVSSPEAKEMLDDLKSIIRKKLKAELGDVSGNL